MFVVQSEKEEENILKLCKSFSE